MLRFFCLFLVLLSSGCTHHQLRFNTVHQAKTVGDVHTQQVLDNLAKFAYNPYSLPHFSFPAGSQSQATDQISGLAQFSFTPRTLSGWFGNFGGNRGNLESFTMSPINDPRKLELMRCAYQQAVLSQCLCSRSPSCPNCLRRFNEFYLGTTNPSKRARRTSDGKPILGLLTDSNASTYRNVINDKNEFNEDIYYFADDPTVIDSSQIEEWKKAKLLKTLYVDDSVESLTERTGKVTIACVNNSWLCVGGQKDVPKRCDCHFVGHYCDTYIWVTESGRDELTKLTLVILDIAINSPAVLPNPTKELELYYDQYGNLASERSKGVVKVTQAIPIDSNPKFNVKPSSEAQELLSEILKEHGENLRSMRSQYLDGSPKSMLDTVFEMGSPVPIDKQKRLRELLAPEPSSSYVPQFEQEPRNFPTPTPGIELLQNNLLYQSLTPQR